MAVWGNNSTHRAYHVTEVTVVVGLEYLEPLHLTQNTTNANIQPTERITGLRYSITPSLPAGLDFDLDRCVTIHQLAFLRMRSLTYGTGHIDGDTSPGSSTSPLHSPSNTDAVFTKDVLIASITMANTGGMSPSTPSPPVSRLG